MRRRGNGEGTIYRRSDGRWGATLTGLDGRRQTVYAGTRQQVQEKLRELVRRRDQGLLLASFNQKTADYLERWLQDSARPSIRPSTFASYSLCVRRLRPLIGAVKLGVLSPAHVQNAYAQLYHGGLSARSVQRTHMVLHRAMRQAVVWGLIARNPTDGASRPRIIPKEMKTLNEEQLRDLFETTEGDRFHCLWVVLATSGIRLGEALGLKWEDVDLDAGRLAVRRALQRHAGIGMVFVEPKSTRSRRSVFLAAGTMAELARHRKAQSELRLAAGPEWQDLDLVFPNALGRPQEANKVSVAFWAALERTQLPRIRIHDLRHTAATLLLLRGVHPKIVQEMLGHSSVALTLDTYSHATPALNAEVAQHMQTLFAR